MAPTPNSALLAAHLREDTADLLALLPAARRAAAGGPGGGEATLDGIARAAYRTLRTAENLAARRHTAPRWPANYPVRRQTAAHLPWPTEAPEAIRARTPRCGTHPPRR